MSRKSKSVISGLQHYTNVEGAGSFGPKFRNRDVNSKSLIDGDEEAAAAHKDNESEYVNPMDRIKYSCSCHITEKYYMLILFAIINFFLFADQNLLAPNLSVIAEEFNMTEDERDEYLGGYISIGFFSVGGIISMLVGYLADTVNRKWVFVVTVAIGEISCAITYFVPTGSIPTFWSGLWLTRAITGFALGGALPLQFSLLGDLFREDERGRAVAFTGIANSLGTSCGQYLANLMEPDWRTPFLIVSLPTFLLLAVFVMTTNEPQRGQAEKLIQGREEVLQNGEEHKLSWAKVKDLGKTPSAVLLIIQGIPGTLPWGTFGTYLNDFMKEDLGIGTTAVANALLLFGLIAAVSSYGGGMVVDRYIETKPKVLPLIAGGTTLVAAIPFIIIVKGKKMADWAYTLLLIPSGIVASIAGPIIKGVLLHVTLPETRGTAFALQSLMDELGKGFGPYIVSLIIKVSPDRSDGMLYGLLGWVPCALLMMSVYYTVEPDQRKTKLALAEAYGIKLSEAELNELEAPDGIRLSHLELDQEDFDKEPKSL